MMTRSLSHYPAIPVLTLWACLVCPLQAQQADSNRTTNETAATNRTSREVNPGSSPAPRSRGFLLRRAPANDPAPGSAQVQSSSDSRSGSPSSSRTTRSTTAASSPRSASESSRSSSASTPESNSRRTGIRNGFGILNSSTSERTQRTRPTSTSRQAPEVVESTEDVHPDLPVSAVRAPAVSAVTVAVGSEISGSASAGFSNSVIPSSLTPGESARHLSGISQSLRNLRDADAGSIDLASQSVAKISTALDAGCEALDPGCRVHARLIRRSLDSVALLLTESSAESDPSKLHLAIERLDAASRNLDSLDRSGN